MKSKYLHFTKAELSCSCGCGLGENEMNKSFMRRIVFLREHLGFPLPITSAMRCPDYNLEISTTGKSGIHTAGKAVDISILGVEKYELVRWAFLLGFTGIGVGKNFIHLDDGISGEMPRPRIWSY